MAGGPSLKYTMVGDPDPAIKAMKKLRGEVDKQNSGIKDSFKKVAGATAGLLAVGGVVDFFKDANAEAREAQKVNAQTAAVLKSTGGAANVSAKDIGNYASSLSKVSAIDDEAIQSGENMLLTFTNLRNEVGKGNDVFNQATQTLVDMSVATGKDMTSSAVQLGKALNDPVKGITALTRVGVTFTEQQKDQIKALVASGHTLDAQKIILRELNKEFGGSAAAQATSSEKMQVAFKNLEEEVGTALIPVIDKVAEILTDDVIPAISGTVHWVQENKTTVEVLAGAVAGLWVAYKGYKVITAASAALKVSAARYSQFVAQLSYSNSKVKQGASNLLQRFTPATTKAAIGVVALSAGAYELGTHLSALLDKGKASAATFKNLTQEADDWKQALLGANGALDDSVRVSVAAALQQNELADKAEKSGVTLNQLTDAVIGNDKAFNSLVAEWKASGKPSGDTIVALTAMHLKFKQTRDSAKDLAGVQKDNNKATKGGADATGDLADASGDATKEIKKQVTALDALTTSFDRFNGRTIDAKEADIAFKNSIADLADAFKGNNKALTDATQAGRDHLSVIFDSIRAAQDDAEATLKRTQSSVKAKQAFQDDIHALRDHLVALGLDKKAVTELLREYAKTPAFKKTRFEADTSGAENDVADFVSRIKSKYGTITLGVRSVSGVSGFATGTGYAPPGWAWVGERGPELLRFRGGEQVLSTPQSMQVSRGYANGTDPKPILGETNYSPTFIVQGITDPEAFTQSVARRTAMRVV